MASSSSKEVRVAELEAELAAAREKRLELELKAERMRAQGSSSSSWEKPMAEADLNGQEEEVQRLVDMGFSRLKSREALQSAGNAEGAIAQLLSQEGDVRERTPLQQLQDMGFHSSQAQEALQRHATFQESLFTERNHNLFNTGTGEDQTERTDLKTKLYIRDL